MLSNRVKVIIIISICVVAATFGAVLIRKSSDFSLSVSPTPSPAEFLPELSASQKPSATAIATPRPVATLTPTPTPQPTQNPTPTPQPTPRTANPPVIDITFPSEMQTVEFTSPDQKLCIVDVPKGGNTEGVQRKHTINDGPWSGYVDLFTLCFDPLVGINRFSVQYKNKYGDESQVYTRQFVFKKSY